MSAALEISEAPNNLSFGVTEPRHLGRVLFGLVIGVMVTFLFIHFSKSFPLKILLGGLCVFTMVRSFVASMRGTDVTLVVTNLDFRSEGRSPNGYKPSLIARADIQCMEFREASGGGEDAENPSGLYVQQRGILLGSSTCVLPDINESQTAQVIEAIYRRFPDTSTLAPSANAEPYLISLNLNQRQ